MRYNNYIMVTNYIMLVCPICEREYKCNKCAYDSHVNKHLKEQGKNIKNKKDLKEMLKMKLKVLRDKKIKNKEINKDIKYYKDRLNALKSKPKRTIEIEEEI